MRIIAGKFKGYKINFPNKFSLRPTIERIRKSLFDWLGNNIKQAKCLDAFAGSGSLGLEAISRGAQLCTFVEKDYVIFKKLQQNMALFDIDNAVVLKNNSLRFLKENSAFDVIFLDPPFNTNILTQALDIIVSKSCNQSKIIYFESTKKCYKLANVTAFKVLKVSTYGDIVFALLKI